jgi:hypothetical protein
LTVIKEDSSLPLLPRKEFLVEETNLRKSLAETAAAAKDFPQAEIDERATQLRVDLEAAKSAINNLRKFPARFGRKQFYDELVVELDALRSAVEDAAASKPAWSKYWALDPPAGLNDDEAGWRQRLQRHSRLRLLRG